MAITEMEFQTVLHHLTGAYEVASEHDLNMRRTPNGNGDYDTSLSELLVELIDRLDYRLAQKLRGIVPPGRGMFRLTETGWERNEAGE